MNQLAFIVSILQSASIKNEIYCYNMANSDTSCCDAYDSRLKKPSNKMNPDFLSRRVPHDSRSTLMERLGPILQLQANLRKNDEPFADLALNSPHDPPVPPSSMLVCQLQHGFQTELQAILESLQRERGKTYWSLTTNHIWVTNGALGGLMMAMKSFSNAGDTIATVVPDDCAYYGMVEGLECAVLPIPLFPEDDFDLNVAVIIRTLHDNPTARILVLTSPNNPSGRISTAEKLQELASALQENNQRRAQHHLPPIILLSDESYHRIVFPSTHQPFISPASFYEYTISVYSYAKPLVALSECLGWLALSPLWPAEKLAMTRRALDAAQISTGWLFPSSVHAQCIPALEEDESEASEEEQSNIPKPLVLGMSLHDLEERRDELVAALSSHGVHLVFPNVIIPQAGFFVMVRVPEAFQPNHDVAFVRLLAERYKILAMPVCILGGFPGWIRFSIAATSEMIRHTCAGIHEFALDYESNDPQLRRWLPEVEWLPKSSHRTHHHQRPKNEETAECAYT